MNKIMGALESKVKCFGFSKYYHILIIMSLLYVMGVSPIIMTISCALILSMSSGKTSKIVTVSLSFAFVVGLSLTYASRKVGVSPYDDFSNITYPIYCYIYNNGLYPYLNSAYQSLGISRIEILTPFFLKIISMFPIELSPSGLIFVLTVTIGLLYIYWIFNYLLPNFNRRIHGPVILISLSLFSFGLCSQITRQMIGIPFLLCSIFERRVGISVLYMIIATLAHISSFPIWILSKLAAKIDIKIIILLFIIIMISEIFFGLTGHIFNAIMDMARSIDKLKFYLHVHDDSSGYNRSMLFFMIISSMLAILSYKSGQPEISRIVILFTIIYFMFYGIPLASARVTMFITTSMIGPLICFSLKNRINNISIISIAIIIFGLSIIRHSVLVDPLGDFALWSTYPMASINIVPFYYAKYFILFNG